jgi:hypothetical protein
MGLNHGQEKYLAMSEVNPELRLRSRKRKCPAIIGKKKKSGKSQDNLTEAGNSPGADTGYNFQLV